MNNKLGFVSVLFASMLFLIGCTSDLVQLNPNPHSGDNTAAVIEIALDGTVIQVGSGSFDFGSVHVGRTSPSINILIANRGNDDLWVSSIAMNGDIDDFILGSVPSSSVISSGDFVTGTVAFQPRTAGNKALTVVINSNAVNGGSFSFTLSGAGITVPEINVVQGDVPILDGISNYEFGSIPVGNQSAPVTFTIENNGTADLDVMGIFFPLEGPGDFAISSGPGSDSVAPGESTDFQVTFSPSSEGDKSTVLYIASNDSERNRYSFTLSGSGIVPDIDVVHWDGANEVDIPEGGYNFGDIPLIRDDHEISMAFLRVKNEGLADLDLSNIELQNCSPDPCEFTISSVPVPSSVGPDWFAPFFVTFSPTSAGSKTVEVAISSNDPDENPYIVALTGNGLAVPDINVVQGETSISYLEGEYDFGNIPMGSSSEPVTFTIKNDGTAPLEVASILFWNSTTITTLRDFAIISGSGPNSVGPGESIDFQVTFSPVVRGEMIAGIYIESNDRRKSSYVFTLSGSGVAPEIDVVRLDGDQDIPIADEGQYDFGDVSLSRDSNPVVNFRIKNEGLANLNVSSVGLQNCSSEPCAFSISAALAASDIAPEEHEDFAVTFAPSSLGSQSVEVVIASNDPDENPYRFRLLGNGSDPEIDVVFVGDAGEVSIPHNGRHDFGQVTAGDTDSAVTQEFLIKNTGNTPLNVASVRLVLSNQTMGPDPCLPGGIPPSPAGQPSLPWGDEAPIFSLSIAPEEPFDIEAGGSHSFSVTFSPDTRAELSAEVEIRSSDADESTYWFTLAGTGMGPQIEIYQDGNLILSGCGQYDFGEVSDSEERVFTVRNVGELDLTVTGSSMSGDDAGEFNSSMVPPFFGAPHGEVPFVVTPGGSQSFAILFTPTTLEPKSASISISSDSFEHASYAFDLIGIASECAGIALTSTPEKPYAGGLGTPEDPYFICTGEQWNQIGLHRDDWDKHFRLAQDISLAEYSGSAYNEIGHIEEVPGGGIAGIPFIGSFDGGGYTISGLSLGMEEFVLEAGLFTFVSNTTLSNVRILNPNVGGWVGTAGALVGHASGATITNVSVIAEHGDVSIGAVQTVGGLVGQDYDSTINNCTVSIKVKGLKDQIGMSASWLGGLVGYKKGGRIQDSRAERGVSNGAEVIGFGTEMSLSAGGLVGYLWQSTVSRSYSELGIQVLVEPSFRNCHAESATYQGAVGGLVGLSSGSLIENSYASGASSVRFDPGMLQCDLSVSLTSHSGGLIGLNQQDMAALPHMCDLGTVRGSYAMGFVQSERPDGLSVKTGGLVGGSFASSECIANGMVLGSVWDKDTTGQATSAGSDPSFGKTTAEMQQRSTYIDMSWDFNNIWEMLAGDPPSDGAYPTLRWQQAVGGGGTPPIPR